MVRDKEGWVLSLLESGDFLYLVHFGDLICVEIIKGVQDDIQMLL